MLKDLALSIPSIIHRSYVPFLQAYFGQEEAILFDQWKRGKEDPESVAQLTERLKSFFGKGSESFVTASGRAALEIGLRALDIEKGGAVLMPTFCCGSVADSILKAGLVPVLADVDHQFNLSIEGVLRCDSQKIRAVIVPHLSGVLNQSMNQIVLWARERNISVIEDCAQAMGTADSEFLVDKGATFSIFSTGLGKQIFTPKGGWITTQNSEFARAVNKIKPKLEREQEDRKSVSHRVETFFKSYVFSERMGGTRTLGRFIRNQSRKITGVTEMGSPHALSSIEAQLIAAQLDKVDILLARARENAFRWRRLLDSIGFESLHVLPSHPNVFSKMLLRFGNLSEASFFRTQLSIHGIGVEDSYTPLHKRAAFRSFALSEYPVCDAIAYGHFCVPVHPSLSASQWKTIANAFNEIAEKWKKQRRFIPLCSKEYGG